MTTQHPAHASADLDVTILGAGHIGFAIALLLKQAGGYRLTVADRDPSRLAEAAALGVHTQLLSDEPSLQAAVDCYHSAEYQAALSHAKGASIRDLVVVEEVE